MKSKIQKLPKPKEKEITAQIRNYLRFKRVCHWKVWQGLGSEKGISDILGILPGGRMLAIEVKTEKGKLSDEQSAFLEKAKQLGALAFVARSLEDVIKEGL